MRIAFYAPMKSPTHPRPSGDRRMARLLWDALAQGGHAPELASAFRSWEGAGDGARQARLARVGGRLAARLVRRYAARDADTRPGLWLSYRVYHKAPDWIGPAVSAALRIPYVLAEASHAPKRAGGPWDAGHRSAAAAIRAARAVIALNPADVPCVRALVDDPRRVVPLSPFLDEPDFDVPPRAAARAAAGARFGLDRDAPWLVAVGMMRADAKLASYRVLAQALARLRTRPWRLVIAGDGRARAAVAEAFAAVPPERVVFAGLLDGPALRTLYGAADLCVWPALDEAYGMALLEAQAAGLPVVAGHGPGVAGIVRDGLTGALVPAGDAAAFAAAVDALLADPAARGRMARAARETARREHHIEAAARTLARVVDRVVAGELP